MGKTLAELHGFQQPLTFREYSLWQAYYRETMNEPSRSDHYLMQIAQQIDSIFGKGKSLDKYKVTFGERRIPTVEEATALSKINLGLM